MRQPVCELWKASDVVSLVGMLPEFPAKLDLHQNEAA